ncbi:hypothetical protein N0V90_006131 [Kalmusia sp. IMI 367209]|nr:hypothetical protein N0V90_006131 [Kalmusia sp. IMI 367209]
MSSTTSTTLGTVHATVIDLFLVVRTAAFESNSAQKYASEDASGENQDDEPLSVDVFAPAPTTAKTQNQDKSRQKRNNRKRKVFHSDHKQSYSCSKRGCTSRIASARYLRRHWKSVHSGVKPYACPVTGCYYTTTRKDTLAKHIIRMHKWKKVKIRETIRRTSSLSGAAATAAAIAATATNIAAGKDWNINRRDESSEIDDTKSKGEEGNRPGPAASDQVNVRKADGGHDLEFSLVYQDNKRGRQKRAQNLYSAALKVMEEVDWARKNRTVMTTERIWRFQATRT